MNVTSFPSGQPVPVPPMPERAQRLGESLERTREKNEQELGKVFHHFVGETFFGQFMQSMRKTVDKPAYFHGGRAEEVFQAQLDQVLAEKMTESTAPSFSAPMFELFQLNRL